MSEPAINDLFAFLSTGKKSGTLVPAEHAWLGHETSELRGACMTILEWIWRHDLETGKYMRPRGRKKSHEVSRLLATVPELRAVLNDKSETMEFADGMSANARMRLIQLVHSKFVPSISVTIVRP